VIEPGGLDDWHSCKRGRVHAGAPDSDIRQGPQHYWQPPLGVRVQYFNPLLAFKSVLRLFREVDWLDQQRQEWPLVAPGQLYILFD
jgi:uncharacterized membrane protein